MALRQQPAARPQPLNLNRRPVCSSSSAARRSLSRALAVAPRAGLQSRGRAYSAESIAVKRVLGEGSYGQVFEVRKRHTVFEHRRKPTHSCRTAEQGLFPHACAHGPRMHR
jgi:hypothetical protein